MGVTIDPSYAFPLPILGINYLDFEFGNPDTRLALLFALATIPSPCYTDGRFQPRGRTA